MSVIMGCEGHHLYVANSVGGGGGDIIVSLSVQTSKPQDSIEKVSPRNGELPQQVTQD